MPLQGGSLKIMPSLEGIIAKGATRQTAKSLEDVMRIFYSGAVHRATGETKMNRVSSRSHAVLTLFIKQKVVINFSFSKERGKCYFYVRFYVYVRGDNGRHCRPLLSGRLL